MDQNKKNRRTESEVDRHIDENLKKVFDDMANQPVPDRFTKLLDQLRTGSSNKPGGADA